MLSVGVHIEEGVAVRTAALSFHNGKTAFEGGFSFPLSESRDETAAAVELVSVLKTAFQKYENQPARFCFALPQNRTACFMSSFPFSEKFKILKTLPFEIEEKTVFQPDSVLFDSRISRSETRSETRSEKGGGRRGASAEATAAGAKTGGENHVLSFVALKENVSAFLAPLERLKIKPWLLSAEGAAFANLAEAWQGAERTAFPSAGSRRICLHLGLKSVLALFFENGFLKDVSVLNWGCEPVVREMAEKYKLSFERAQEEFNEKAFVLTAKKGFSKEQEAFSALIQNHLKPLVQALKLRKLSLESGASGGGGFGGGDSSGESGAGSGEEPAGLGDKESKNLLPWEIFLTGPGAVIRNLSSYLSLKLSLPVYRVKLLEKVPFDCGEEDLLIATGLAMEGLKPPPWSGLNFLRSVQTEKSRFLSLPRPAFLLIFLAALFYSVVRKEEAGRLSDRAHEVFASAAKKIAFIRGNRLSEEKVREFLRKKEGRAADEERIRHVLQAKDAMDHLKTMTKHLKNTAREGNLKIRFMEIDRRRVHIEGLIEESHALQLKRRMEFLSENGKLSRRPSSFEDKPASPPPRPADGADSKTDSRNESGADSAAGLPDGSEPGRMTAFSYSFTLKNNL